MNDHDTTPRRTPRRRDPLSLGFEAHRGLLLLRLRLRTAAHTRRHRT
ncbi:hypothetical protein [Mycolicibacterium sediminis]|nr:hypothetical protein [Mycolicibacterium sediminis]